MRVAYIGRFNHPWSTENYLCDALEDIGHEVLRLHEHSREARTVFLLSPDLIIWTHPDIRTAKRITTALRDTPTAGVTFDRFWGVDHREHHLSENPWWQLNHIFTPDGTDVDWGRVSHHWLPPGMDERQIGLAKPNRQRWRHPVVFIGKRVYPADWPWHETLTDYLASRKGAKVYGDLPVREADLSQLIASSKVVVGDSWIVDTSRYWSNRLPETLGRGGLTAFPYTEGISEQFPDSLDAGAIVFYEPYDLDSLSDAIDTILTYGKTRREKAQRAAMAEVKAKHTWRHRVEQILETTCA